MTLTGGLELLGRAANGVAVRVERRNPTLEWTLGQSPVYMPLPLTTVPPLNCPSLRAFSLPKPRLILPTVVLFRP